MDTQFAFDFHPGQLSPEERAFVDYFDRVPPRCLQLVEDLYRGRGPRGFGASLLLARMLKVKEGIVSDRELCERLGRIRLYQVACRLKRDAIPSPSTFSEFRDRLAPAGYRSIHNRWIEAADALGLLDPAIPGLPKNRRPGIILIADSTFLITAGSTTGEKQADGTWKFTDPTACFGRRHPHHRYAVGHRAHTLTTVTGIPLVSRVVGANEADVSELPALVAELADRYGSRYLFAYLLLDAGYDAEDAYRLLFEEYGIVAVIIQEKEAKARVGFTRDWRPLCPFNFAMRRNVIDYQRRRTKWACWKVCRQSPQPLLFDCEHLHRAGERGLVRYTRFRDGYRMFGPAAPNTQIYEFLKMLRTGIERVYGLLKENRYLMEVSNTYVGADNVLMHVMEHDLVLTHDVLYDAMVHGKVSPVLDVHRKRGRSLAKPWTKERPPKKKTPLPPPAVTTSAEASATPATTAEVAGTTAAPGATDPPTAASPATTPAPAPSPPPADGPTPADP